MARASVGVIDGGGLVGGEFATLVCRKPFVSLSIAATAELTRVPRTLLLLTIDFFGSSEDSEFFVETFPKDEDLG